jgi:hypothetical protein
MLLLFLSMALTDTQQLQHDATEWRMYQRITADDAAIANMWRPPAKLLVDYRKARRCYVLFHLYRKENCSSELMKVQKDLGDVETALTQIR